MIWDIALGLGLVAAAIMLAIIVVVVWDMFVGPPEES